VRIGEQGGEEDLGLSWIFGARKGRLRTFSTELLMLCTDVSDLA
jgi:hypothetical protein